ncbi:MAG TPA: hypothetical protein VGF32_15225, partial [Streptosporangiaceae bacterium]
RRARPHPASPNGPGTTSSRRWRSGIRPGKREIPGLTVTRPTLEETYLDLITAAGEEEAQP